MHGNHYLDRSAGGRRRREANPNTDVEAAPVVDSSRIPAAFNPVYSNTKEGKEARRTGRTDPDRRSAPGPQILFDVIAAVGGGN